MDDKIIENFCIDLKERLLPGFTLTIWSNNRDFMIFDSTAGKYVISFTLLELESRVYFRYADRWIQAFGNYNKPDASSLRDILEICDIVFDNYHEWSNLVSGIESEIIRWPNQGLFMEAVTKKLVNLGLDLSSQWKRYCLRFSDNLPHNIDRLVNCGLKSRYIEYDRA